MLFANLTIRWLDKANVDRAMARSSEVAAQYAAQPPTPAGAANNPPRPARTPPRRAAPEPPHPRRRRSCRTRAQSPPGADAAIRKDAPGGFAEKVRAAAGDLVTAVDVVPLPPT